MMISAGTWNWRAYVKKMPTEYISFTDWYNLQTEHGKDVRCHQASGKVVQDSSEAAQVQNQRPGSDWLRGDVEACIPGGSKAIGTSRYFI